MTEKSYNPSDWIVLVGTPSEVPHLNDYQITKRIGEIETSIEQKTAMLEVLQSERQRRIEDGTWQEPGVELH